MGQKDKTWFLPGVLLEANLFGYGQRKYDQHWGQSDGELAIGVPVRTNHFLWLVIYCANHCRKNDRILDYSLDYFDIYI